MKSTLLLGFIRTFAPAFGYAENKSQILNNKIMRKVIWKPQFLQSNESK